MALIIKEVREALIKQLLVMSKMTNCPYCGVQLLETSWGRRFCPNHGIIEEEKEDEYKYQNKEEGYKPGGYIG